MKNELIVEQDRYVSINVLVQEYTYKGLLEGVPTDTMNQRMIKNLESKAIRYCGNMPVYVIEPKQTPHPHARPNPFETPMSLPAYTCIAQLSDYKPARDEEMFGGSQLIVVWFQDTLALPIDDDILEKMKQIKWTELAEDITD
jgi:hypothetical protein